MGLRRPLSIDICTDVQVSAAEVIAPTEAAALAELFRLLGDPTRTRILCALLEPASSASAISPTRSTAARVDGVARPAAVAHRRCRTQPP